MQVAIIGCGPAGLLAAHAAERKGHEAYIFSPKKKSFISGAQFLHVDIPGLTTEEPDGVVEFRKWGDERGYQEKIYGGTPVTSSWNAYRAGGHDVWNMKTAYHKLWELYQEQIVDRELIYSDLTMLLGEFPKVISTAPLRAICAKPSEHTFRSQPVWITPEAPDIPNGVHRIIYNGRTSEPWYRQSRIFGNPGTEWPYEPHNVEAVKIFKPLGNNCDCHPGVMRMGRYGRWEKGPLIHHAYEMTGALLP